MNARTNNKSDKNNLLNEGRLSFSVINIEINRNSNGSNRNYNSRNSQHECEHKHSNNNNKYEHQHQHANIVCNKEQKSYKSDRYSGYQLNGQLFNNKCIIDKIEHNNTNINTNNDIHKQNNKLIIKQNQNRKQKQVGQLIKQRHSQLVKSNRIYYKNSNISTNFNTYKNQTTTITNSQQNQRQQSKYRCSLNQKQQQQSVINKNANTNTQKRKQKYKQKYYQKQKNDQIYFSDHKIKYGGGGAVRLDNNGIINEENRIQQDDYQYISGNAHHIKYQDNYNQICKPNDYINNNLIKNKSINKKINSLLKSRNFNQQQRKINLLNQNQFYKISHSLSYSKNKSIINQKYENITMQVNKDSTNIDTNRQQSIRNTRKHMLSKIQKRKFIPSALRVTLSTKNYRQCHGIVNTSQSNNKNQHQNICNYGEGSKIDGWGVQAYKDADYQLIQVNRKNDISQYTAQPKNGRVNKICQTSNVKFSNHLKRINRINMRENKEMPLYFSQRKNKIQSFYKNIKQSSQKQINV